MRTVLPLLAALASSAVGCYRPNIADNGFKCHADEDYPPCPEGYDCIGGFCHKRMQVSRSCSDVFMAQTQIAKTAHYSGDHQDPGLGDQSMCPDNSLEPNDGPDENNCAVAIQAPPDVMTSKLTHMAICPRGVTQATGAHDVDYFRVDTSGASDGGALTLKADIFYDIKYGDLDVGIFDSNGRLLAADGSAMTDGCAAASVSAGVYYVVVVGAGATDTNNYDIRIRTYSTPVICPNATIPLDMSL
jgi:hypothetical protein